jgi:hypothetical protein
MFMIENAMGLLAGTEIVLGEIANSDSMISIATGPEPPPSPALASPPHAAPSSASSVVATTPAFRILELTMEPPCGHGC